MIRKKKTETEDILNSISEYESDLDSSYDLDSDLEPIDDNEDQESEQEDKKKSFSFPWKKAKVKEEASGEEVEEEAESDPLDLNSEEVEYVDLDEKKLPLKKILLMAGIAVVCVAGIIVFIVKNMNAGDDSKVYVESVSVLAGLGTANGGSNRYTGVVEPQSTWKITLDADMSVEKCFVKVGDEVKKGDKLFRYNTEELKLNLDKKNLELDTLNNEISQLSKDINTYESDLKNASSTEKIELQTQILTAQTTIKKNEYSIKSAKQEIEKIEANIKDATVTSKMDGVIKNINTALGEGSSSSDDEMSYDSSNSEDSSTYMTVLAIGDYRVKGKINETNASSIEEGQAMIVRSRVDEQTWHGTVQTIKTEETADDSSSSNEDYYGDYGNSSDTASNYNFYVELDSDEGLMMGQHVFLEPDNGQDEEKEGYWISSAYILVEEDNYYVWADNKDRLEKRSVEVGEYDETLDEYQILSGITEEDYIACDDIDLKDGMKTTKVDPYAEENSTEDGEGNFGSDEMNDEFDEESYDDEESSDDEGYDSVDEGSDITVEE